jgi:hypothetical protein
MNNPENMKMQEIEELERQLAARKAAIREGAQFERQAEIGRENFSETQPAASSAPDPMHLAASDDIAQQRETAIAEDIRAIATMDELHKVETLVALALDKGVTHSVEVAYGLQDPYILDVLHDKLLCELHDRLVKENKLTEV